jgi:hypothetical protein
MMSSDSWRMVTARPFLRIVVTRISITAFEAANPVWGFGCQLGMISDSVMISSPLLNVVLPSSTQ